MKKEIVITLTGHDRVGIVKEITNVMVKHGGNVETSRMARLGGEFAMLALVSLDEKDVASFEANLQSLKDEGFQVTLLQTEDDHAKNMQAGCLMRSKCWVPTTKALSMKSRTTLRSRASTLRMWKPPQPPRQ